MESRPGARRQPQTACWGCRPAIKPVLWTLGGAALGDLDEKPVGGLSVCLPVASVSRSQSWGLSERNGVGSQTEHRTGRKAALSAGQARRAAHCLPTGDAQTLPPLCLCRGCHTGQDAQSQEPCGTLRDQGLVPPCASWRELHLPQIPGTGAGSFCGAGAGVRIISIPLFSCKPLQRWPFH